MTIYKHLQPALNTVRKLCQSEVLKNFFIYSFGTVLIKGIAVLLMPLIMHMLTPSEFGLYSLSNNFISILAVLLGFGLRNVFFIEFFHCNGAGRVAMLNDIITTYLIVSTPIFLLLLGNISSINHYVFVGNTDNLNIVICLAICFVTFFVEMFYQALRYRKKAWELTTLQIAIALTTIFTNIIMLYVFKLGVRGMLLGYLAGLLLGTAKGLYEYLSRRCHITLNVQNNLERIHYYLIKGIPFVPNVLFSWVLASGDKWTLAKLSSMHNVGIYSLADICSQLFHMLILYPLSGSYIPYLFEQFNQNKNDLMAVERKNERIMYLSMAVVSILAVITYMLGRPLLYWIIPSKYHEAIQYMLLIVLGNVFVMGTYFGTALIQYHKKTLFLGFSLCLPAVTNIALNFLLIPHYAIYGCIIATLIAYVMYFVLVMSYNYHLRGRYHS